MSYRVGFVIDSRVPSMGACCHLRCSPRVLLCGWPSGSAVAEMRFGWLADWVRQHPEAGLSYELYKPYRRYDAVVFLKSMGPECTALAARLRRRGVRTIFDANVDYFTPAGGELPCSGLSPTAEQREEAVAMARTCDGVIGDSRHIAAVAATLNPSSVWIPDNVRDDWISSGSPWRPRAGEALPLLWCGEAHKLFELLRIRDVLQSLASRIHLRLVTNSLSALNRWRPATREAFDAMLAGLSHEIVPYVSNGVLISEYDRGGVFISPRFLDNTYNAGHTEWKITLPMARGRAVLCSGQPSYVDVAGRSGGRGLRICRTDAEWSAALADMLDGRFDWTDEQAAASDVVRQHYSTSLIARRHADWIRALIRGDALPGAR